MSRWPSCPLHQRGRELERRSVAHLLGHALDCGRIVEVSSGGHLGKEEMEPDQQDQDFHVTGRKAHTSADLGHQVGADVRVVAGESLADVMEERADHQEIGSLTRSAKSAALAVASSRWRSTVKRW